jgi:Xaa-Pro aminopeptidase
MDHPASLNMPAPAQFAVPMTPRERFAARRERVRAQLGERAVMILPASRELHVGADTELRYVVDSDLYYLTGYTEPDAVFVLSSESEGFVMFVRPRDAARELWTGVRGGVEAAQAEFGATAAYPIDALATELPRLLSSVDRVYARTATGRAEYDNTLADAVSRSRKGRARSGRGAVGIIDPGVVLDEMRLYKDTAEIAVMRAAAAISVAAFAEARALIRPGAGEWEIEAALQAGFRRRRGSGEAFPSIVGSGANATVLHYISNDGVLQDGDFVLLDAGARAGMYCADITRTYAIGGAGSVNSARQHAYDVVRSAHHAGIAACRAGAALEDVDNAARRELIRGMIELKLVTGPVDDALARDDYKRYFPHRTCHWLGLDVHDVGSYVAADGSARRLESGMVFTVEPGLYIPANDETAPADLRGTGIRLEDDVLITDTGAEVLTSALPIE